MHNFSVIFLRVKIKKYTDIIQVNLIDNNKIKNVLTHSFIYKLYGMSIGQSNSGYDFIWEFLIIQEIFIHFQLKKSIKIFNVKPF